MSVIKTELEYMKEGGRIWVSTVDVARWLNDWAEAVESKDERMAGSLREAARKILNLR